MFKRADELGGGTVCRARPIVILIWERAKGSIGLFPHIQFLVGTGLVRIGHEQTFETAEPCSHLTCF